MIDGCGVLCQIALMWMSMDLTDDKSTLVQVMAWCRQATSHYLSQCWPRSMSPSGITRPQRVNVGSGLNNSFIHDTTLHLAQPEIIMALCNECTFCITAPLSGESTGQWFPLTDNPQCGALIFFVGKTISRFAGELRCHNARIMNGSRMNQFSLNIFLHH